mmetsp:Transcript_10041/g.19356  ORF Transcript_10041/g.19356 Transcript_10041/m.19356 type:complete len:80 (+) Transcript_10041:156-395(+)
MVRAIDILMLREPLPEISEQDKLLQASAAFMKLSAGSGKSIRAGQKGHDSQTEACFCHDDPPPAAAVPPPCFGRSRVRN